MNRTLGWILLVLVFVVALTGCANAPSITMQSYHIRVQLAPHTELQIRSAKLCVIRRF